jgi:RibD domain-containing protein
MGKIVSNFFMSLDGVVEAPDKWHMSYFNDEMGAAVGKGMATNRGFLMGRVLYDEWAAYWPKSDDDFATFFNSHPKYVVSNSLETADWSNTTIISGDAAQQLQELKDATTATSWPRAAPRSCARCSPTECSTSSASSCIRSSSATEPACSRTPRPARSSSSTTRHSAPACST